MTYCRAWLFVFILGNFSCQVSATTIKSCTLNPELFYYSTAQSSDRLRLIEFAVQSNERFNKRSVTLDRVREILTVRPEQINSGLVVTLKQKDCPATLGFYALREIPKDIVKKKIELTLLYVNPDYTRKGLGSLLLKRAMRHAKKLGMRTMNLISMPEAKYFYAKHGAKQTALEKNLFNPGGEPVVLYDFDLTSNVE